MNPFKPDDVILFQGDSITDLGRGRDVAEPNSPQGMGGGYARFAASTLLADHPDKNLRIFNRGISGNTVGQLEERWQADCLDLQPTVLSILIGINDVVRWKTDSPNGRPAAEYDATYRRILDVARQQNPDLRLIICQPFCLPVNEDLRQWMPELHERQAMAERIAGDYDAAWVPFQALFDGAVKEAPPTYWMPDGVHPTLAGHMRMARRWLDVIGQ